MAHSSSIPQSSPGFSANLFANRNAHDDTVMIGGIDPNETEWVYTLTKRAARSLWFDLTRLLFPEKSDEVIAQVATVPSLPPRNPDKPYLTSHTFVTARPDGGCEISGWIGEPAWSVRLSAYEVYRFWAALDMALFPTGW